MHAETLKDQWKNRGSISEAFFAASFHHLSLDESGKSEEGASVGTVAAVFCIRFHLDSFLDGAGECVIAASPSNSQGHGQCHTLIP